MSELKVHTIRCDAINDEHIKHPSGPPGIHQRRQPFLFSEHGVTRASDPPFFVCAVKHSTHGTIERYTFFWQERFLNDGTHLNQKNSSWKEAFFIFLHDFLVVYVPI